MKKLLISVIILLFSVTTVYANGFVKAEFDVNVVAFNGIDAFSTVTLSVSSVEIELESNVTVRVMDRFGDPLVGHTVVLYVDGDPEGVSFVQPEITDEDGFAYGKVKTSKSGTYVIRAYDSTYGENISILESATLYSFPTLAPVLKEEPYYTKGTTNTLYWDDVEGSDSYEYYLQISENEIFTSGVSNSGWVDDNQYQFTDLISGQMYFYRIKARNSGAGESSWSNTRFSVQDSVSPTIKIINPGELVGDKNFGNVKLEFSIADDLGVDEVNVFCRLRSGILDKCGTMQKNGNRYTFLIPLTDLERGFLFSLLDSYTFCVEASDFAGNTTDSCGFSIVFTHEDEGGGGVIPPSEDDGKKVSISLNLINQLLNGFNKSVQLLENVSYSFVGSLRLFGLQLLSVFIFVMFSLVGFTVSIGSILYIPFIIKKMAYSLLEFFGVRPSGLPIGIVYDSVSRKPLSYAKVDIYDSKNRLIRSDYTDRDGIFTGSIETGRYRVVVNRSHYLFPSNIVKGKKDDNFNRVYHAENFIVSKRNPMNIAIPLDPINMYDKNEKKRIFQYHVLQVLGKVNILIAAIGLAVSLYTLDRSPVILNVFLVLIYIPAIWIYIRSVFSSKIGIK